MIIIWRVWYLLGLGGLLCLAYGFGEWHASEGASLEPVVCDLATLENGGPLPDRHIQLGEHWAYFTDALYLSRSSGEHTDATSVHEVYYPVISTTHPTMRAWSELEQKYPGLEGVPEEEYPALDSFRVLISSDQFRCLGDVPGGWMDEPQRNGLVVGTALSLDDETKSLLLSDYPRMNLAQVLLVESDRRPKTWWQCMQWILGGVFLLVLGLKAFLKKRQEKRRVPPRLPAQAA